MNPELIKAAEEAAREAAMQYTFNKLAVIPASAGDPTAGGQGAGMPGGPGMLGGPGAPPPGGDPSMGGAMPPGGDPSAAMGPTDPALAAAGGGIGDQVRQMVQQELMAQGGKPGGAGAGKSAKPDVAVELAKLNDLVYKLGMMLTSIAKEMGVEFPAATLLGPAPPDSDPALAQAANAVPAPSAGPPSGAGGADQGGSAQPPFPPIQPLSGDPGDAGAKSASIAALGKAASDIAALMGFEDDGFDDELISGMHATKVADYAAPDVVGYPITSEAINDFVNMMPESVTHAQPVSLAKRIRQKTRV